MKIAIVGAGVVGTATGLGLARFGHQVWMGDINHNALEQSRLNGLASWPAGEPPPPANLYLICTPEGEVPKVVRSLSAVEGELVIRSSTLPGTTQRLADELGRPVFHNPEFLREATALDDFLHTRTAILGRAEGWWGGDRLEALYQQMDVRVVWTNSTVSEMVKLAVNNYLATLISFWNEVHLLCKKVGINSHQVGRLAALDPRVAPYGACKHGEPYSGKCLPKDNARMIDFYRTHGLEPLLLEAVRATNLRMEGSRSNTKRPIKGGEGWTG